MAYIALDKKAIFYNIKYMYEDTQEMPQSRGAKRRRDEEQITSNLVKLKKWAKKWLIKFNPLKTEVMVISNSHNDYDIYSEDCRKPQTPRSYHFLKQ